MNCKPAHNRVGDLPDSDQNGGQGPGMVSMRVIWAHLGPRDGEHEAHAHKGK